VFVEDDVLFDKLVEETVMANSAAGTSARLLTRPHQVRS
jgi:hypothetical protein